ncbi:Hypothetical protein I595_2535 [Croceitalea dokdonensis DOKDO 023]|uniref:Uncharacterized protein n=1 Tax=Croceitalea dokdonensis DOKDO 023 TaxID=1300341 RepID=A0A0P7ATS4_9FLAO|nr:Hypothetical protein I595_2535 [Croceitalea dokdonensis DOKDO 023]
MACLRKKGGVFNTSFFSIQNGISSVRHISLVIMDTDF